MEPFTWNRSSQWKKSEVELQNKKLQELNTWDLEKPNFFFLIN